MPSCLSSRWAQPALRTLQGLFQGLFAVVLSLLFLGFAAAAADFTLGSAEGIWTNADVSVSGLNTSSISWGTSTGYGTSGFDFDGVTNESFNAGETFLIGTFTHHNKPVYGTTPTKLALEITLDFDSPAVSPNPSFTYVLDFDETPNSCDGVDNPLDCCPSWQDSDTPCDDRILFPSGSPTDTFWVGNTKYALEILGFTSSPYGGSGISQFVTEELKDNVAYVVGRLTVVCTMPAIDVLPEDLVVDVAGTAVFSIGASGDSLSYQWYKDGLALSDGGDITGTASDTLTIANVSLTDEGTYEVRVANPCGAVDASATLTAETNPVLQVEKTGDPTTASIGDAIAYAIIVQHAPSSDGTDVEIHAVEDSLGIFLSLDSGDNGNGLLEDGEIWLYTGTREVAPSDPVALLNEVCVRGEDREQDQVVACGSTTTTIVHRPSLSIHKTGSSSVPIGQTIDYTITVTNTGDIPLHNVVVSDPKLGLDAPFVLLAVGGSVTVHGSYGPVTEADLPLVENTATATSDETDPEEDHHETTVISSPSLSIEKSGPGAVNIGDPIHYTMTVTNTGDVTLHNISVIDAKLGLNETIASLAVGASETLQGIYGPVVEADLPSVVNTATADSDETDPVEDGHTTTVLADPGLSIVKSGPASANIGDTVEYTVTVTNTGDVTLHNVVILDPTLSLSLIVDLLGVGEEVVLTPAYGPVAEGDAPAIVNTATAEADEIGPVADTHTLTVLTHPALSIEKSGPAATRIGDTVEYTITVTNTGDITLHNVSVADAKLGIDHQVATLAAGDAITLQETYGPVDEGDLPSILNTATASADEVGPISDDHTVPITTYPSMILAKSGPASADIGETVTYEIVITNTGDVTLHNVSVTDAKLGIFDHSIGTLGVGASEILRPTYGPIVEGDLPEVVNTATAVSDETGPVSDSHTITIATHPSLSIEKLGDSTVNIGESIDYTITVTNTGDVTLHHLSIVDPMLGLSETLTSLAPGASETFVGSYGSVTEGDLPSVTNQATADSDETGQEEASHTTVITPHPALAIEKTGPATASIGDTIAYTITVTNSGDVTLQNVAIADTLLGLAENIPTLAPGASETVSGSYGPVTEEDVPSVFNTAAAASDEVSPVSDTHTVTIPTHPSLAIEKSGPATANIGETIDYTITITNTGDVTLHNVVVADPKLGISETFASLAPGAEETISGSYGPVIEDDVPSMWNTATAEADEVGLVSDSHTVQVVTHPALAIEKTGPATASIGDTVDYTITVTNTGDVTLHNVVVIDNKLGISESLDSLAPGASESVFGTYSPITEGDLPSILNTATADSDETEPVSDDHTVSVATHPALAIEKTGPATANIGDTVDYTITVTNTGDVTLHNVVVIDTKLGISESLDSLAPSASESVSGTYGPIAEGDLPSILNTAIADSDETESVSDDHTVSVATHPSMAIDKSGPATASIGDTVDYTITVTNTGDVTLHNVVVTDTKLGISESLDNLAPGGVILLSGAYGPVLEEDVPSVLNTASALADEVARVTDDHSVTIATHPALAIDKTGTQGPIGIGGTVNYTITVANVGDITLHNVTVDDEMLGIDEAFAALAPGQSKIVSGSYGPITEEDVPVIENTVTADSDETEPVSDSHSVGIESFPGLAIEKTGDASTGIGETVDYTITVTNIGDVTLHNVVVTDARLGIDETFASLAPGQSEIVGGSYGPVIEEDGPVIENTATADSDETEPVSDSHNVPVTVNPGLGVEKTGDASTGIGGIVNYTITVTNIGDVTLHNVVVTDARLEIDETFASLAPGQSEIVGGSYGPVVEEDGPVIENTATADSDETEPVSDAHNVIVNTNPGLAIEKTGDASTGIGETVGYTITVTNIGDVTLHNVVVTDAKLGIDETFAALAPGESQIVSGSYGPVTEEDVPVIENTAAADSDETEPVSDSHNVPVNTNPGLGLEKTGPAITTIGETVDYTITVTNIGDVTLHDVHVVDAMLGIDETFASLVPGASIPVSSSYGPVTEEDVPRIENTATADSDVTEPISDSHSISVTTNPGLAIEKTGDQGPTRIGETVNYTITVTNIGDVTLHQVHVVDAMLGIDRTVATLSRGEQIALSGTYGPVTEDDTPGPIVNTATADSDETEPVTDTYSIGIESFPALSLDKTGDASTAIGETVDYTITVTNIGDITLHNVVINDPKLGISETFAALAPGQSEIVSGSYGPVVEEDVPVIENTATADSDETDPVSDSHVVPVNTSPGLAIDKTGDLSAAIGQTVDYAITVSNTGDVTLHNVRVVDAMLGIDETFATLAPGASILVSGTYGPVAEGDAPAIENTATANSDETEPVSDSHNVPVTVNPGLSIVKSGPAGATVGDSIEYTITVTNTGDLTLHNVVVTDARLGISERFDTLAPGASRVVFGTYGPVLEQDIPTVVNTATASSDETEPVVDSHTVRIAPALIDLSLAKTVSNETPVPGEIVVFRIRLANAPESADASGVKVTDRLPSGYSFLASAPSQGGYNSATGLWTVGDLNAGDSATLELTAIVQPNGEYTSPAEVTDADQEDVDSTPANADSVSEDDDDAASVSLRLADLSVSKTVDQDEPGIGDTIEFTLTVTNLGPSDATGVAVSDPLPFGLSYVSDDGFGIYSPITDLWQIGTVPHGDSVSLTITARVEANAGSTLVNTAEIESSDLLDPDPTNNQDSASIDVIAADLRVTKIVDNPTPAVGEEIVFTIQVTNRGPDTATNVRLNDMLPEGLTYISDDAPGTYLPATGLWTIALLPVGTTDTLRITAVPDADTAGTTLTNRAEVTATQVDPNPSDNADTAEVDIQDTIGGGGGGQDACTGKVIINEIAWAGTAASVDDEWIELRNVGGEPVDLTGWTLRWRKKDPIEPEDFEWRVVPLSGVLHGAHVSACELAEHDPTPSVDFEKRDIDDISWRVISRPIDLDESYLLVERRTDKTVSTNDADVVYDTVEPYNMELHNEGEIIELLDADGIVVDSANAFPMPNPAWPAGDAATYATMERTDPLEPDTPDNWHTNLGITTWGRDALDRPLVATADTVNSRPLEEMEIFADLTPTKTLAGARLEVALELSRQERRESGWPWIRVTRPIPAGGGGEALAPASYSFASRYSNDLYWLGIDTTGLPAGDYLVWVVYGDGETVLVPITILP